MDTFMITTTGSYEVMINLFNAIASIFSSHDGSFVKTMIKLSTTVAVLSTVMYSIFASHLKPLGIWFVSYMVILNGLLLPVSQVVVKDSMTGQFGTVDNVPFGLAVVASGFNQFSHAFTGIIEQAFQPTPGVELELKEGAVSRLSYLQTGFIFGAHALLQMRGLQITNVDFADNMKEFVQQCVVIDCLIGQKYTLHDLKNTNNIWALVSYRPSKIRGFSWRTVERTEKGKLAQATDSQIITCAEGVERINKLWAESMRSTTTDIVDGLKQALGLKGDREDSEKISAHMTKYMPFALSHLMGVASQSSETIKQQLMIDTVVDATERKAVELGAAPNFEARRAYLLQRTQNETTGHVMAMTLPFFKTVVEALMYALFLFVFPLALLPKGWQMVCIWTKGCLWVNLWPPLFAILNFFITEGLRLKVGGQVSTGLSIANNVGVYNAAADIASIAGWLSASIPLISWWIVDRSTYSLVNMATSMLSTSQSAVAAAAQESFTGNYSYGNINLDNTQGSQTNLFKHDTSPSYNAGHFVTNDGISSIVTGSSGEQVLNVARSTIPVEIDSASYQESQIRDAQTREMGIYTSESEKAIEQQTSAVGEYLEFGEQASQLSSSGKHFSTQETASVTQEAASVYNKLHSIADHYRLDESLVKQFAAKKSAGVSVDVSFLKFANIGGGISAEKSESSQATLQKAAEEITQLSQSQEFRESMQHMQQAVQADSLDTQTQEMQHKAHSMNKHLEKSQSHQKEATKAFVTAQNLSHSAERIHGDSQRINLVETQEFIKYAAEKLGGIEAVEKMAINNPHHLKALGDQFLREKHGSLKPLPGISGHKMPTNNTHPKDLNAREEISNLHPLLTKGQTKVSHDLGSNSSSQSTTHKLESGHLNEAQRSILRKDKPQLENNEVPINLPSGPQALESSSSSYPQTSQGVSAQQDSFKPILAEQNQQVVRTDEYSPLKKTPYIGNTEEQQQNLQHNLSMPNIHEEHTQPTKGFKTHYSQEYPLAEPSLHFVSDLAQRGVAPDSAQVSSAPTRVLSTSLTLPQDPLIPILSDSEIQTPQDLSAPVLSVPDSQGSINMTLPNNARDISQAALPVEQTQQTRAPSEGYPTVQPKAFHPEPTFDSDFIDNVLHTQQEITSEKGTPSRLTKPSESAAIPIAPEIIFEDSMYEKADPRIQPQPLNKPSIVGQVQQMVTLTKQSIQTSGEHLKDKTVAKQQQFDNRLKAFGKENFSGSVMEVKMQKLLKDKENQ